MNDHPLGIDLISMADDELDKRYNELSRRWHLARRMGMDGYVLHQLDIMLSSIEEEKQRRALVSEDSNPVLLDTDPLPNEESKKR
jgi:hypothetical protein